MKKRILAILVAVLCVAFVLSFASCNGGGDDKKDCTEHTYGEWTTVTPESCTEKGLEKRVCSNCSFEETREIEASHNWKSWETTTPATCLVDGEKTRECRECDATETETIKAQGHVKEVTTEAKEPTLTAPGTTEGAKCKNCDYIFSVAVEIPKIGNIAKPDLVTVTQGSSWHSFETPMQYLFDGKADTAPNSPKGTPYTITFDLGETAYVYEVKIVCNGMGTVYDKWGSKKIEEVKYNVKTVAITCYKDGEIVGVQRFEELNENEVTEVTLKDVNCAVDKIEVYVESAGNNVDGDSYLWDINVVGTRQLTVCEANGHAWSDWVPEVEVTCETDGSSKRTCSECGLTEERVDKTEGHTWSEEGVDAYGDIFKKEPTCSEEGYIGKMCTKCFVTSTEKIPTIQHDWDAWVVLSGDCVSGATRTRKCKVCKTPETETSEPGEHANIIYEGAKAPTKTEDGSTGVKMCAACNTKLEDAKILRIVNAALGGTIETTPTAFWAWNNPSNLLKIADGNRETGIFSDPNLLTTTNTITFNEALNVYEVVLVVNSKGNIAGGDSFSETTNKDYKIQFVILDENNESLFVSEQISTLDKTEIVVPVELPEGKLAKTINVMRTVTGYGVSDAFIWEVEAFAEKALTACEASGTHAWGEWTGTEPVCSQEGLTDGVKTRECSVCGETETQTTPATHSFGAWDETNVSCATGGVRTKTCSSCGKVESETIPAGDHVETELQGAKEPTFEEDGSTGALVCTKCGETVEAAKVIPKLVNEAANAVVGTTGGWAIDGSTGSTDTRPYLNDGNMTTGMTTYTAQGTTTHSLTWSSAVTIDTIKVYFNGDGTGKTVGHFSGQLSNTNTDTTITVKVYGADGTTIIKTETIATKDLTEYTIDLGEAKQVSKIDLDCYVGWEASKVVNVWECQAYKTYKAEE